MEQDKISTVYDQLFVAKDTSKSCVFTAPDTFDNFDFDTTCSSQSIASIQAPLQPTVHSVLTGASAYYIWLEQGNTGTEQDFIDSLKIDEAAFIELEFTGTSGQTDFAFAYEDEDYIEVFYNGRLLSQTDWVASNNTTISLTLPVSNNGDLIFVRKWNKFEVTDQVSDEDVQTVYDSMGTVSDFENSL